MYFRLNLLIYQFAKIFVEKTNSQTSEKCQWCHILKNRGSSHFAVWSLVEIKFPGSSKSIVTSFPK
jgi:hypothetical protein